MNCTLFGDGTPYAIHYPRWPGYGATVEVEVQDLSSVGWIRITEVGEENIYFLLPSGQRAFCKLG